MLMSSSRQPSRTVWGLALYAALVSCSLLFSACYHQAERGVATLPEDVLVIDHYGKPFSLASLKGKVVLLDFVHIGCPTVCTTLTSKFGQVADRLGQDLGSKVILLSVTNDPEHDGPQQLLALAKSSDADLNGWIFATGKPENVDRVIRAFGLKNDRLPDGSPNHITQVFLVGPDGRAMREYQGMVMNAQQVVSHIREALAQGSAS
jgi:cytochrome oxidase Cu insertion factor (SCO1/SenC/PrrC family)